MSAPSPFGTGIVTRRVRVRKDRVALLRYLLEAEDGLGSLYGDGTDITLFAPESQAEALDRAIHDYAAEGLIELVEA